MKKRIVSLLLALIMIVGMIPVTAFAADMKTSDDAIEILKKYEDFQSKPYQYGTAWYIGYGTNITAAEAAGIYKDGITQAKATELMKEDIKDRFEAHVNTFIKNNNLSMNQAKFDALVVHSYNRGPAWLTDANDAVRKAVLNGKTGMEFKNAMVQSCSASGEVLVGLINRRLCEANMYLNGVYSTTAPSGHGYVVVDANGGTADYSVYLFNNTTTTNIDFVAKNGTKKFMGWYVDNVPVSVLSSKISGKTIQAMWDSATVSYTIKLGNLVSKTVYAASQTSATVVGTLNTDFAVTMEKVVDGYKWVYGSGKNSKGTVLKGWVCLGDAPSENPSSDKILATATVIATTNVRESATNQSTLLGSLAKDTVVKVIEYKGEATETGNKTWGKIIYGTGYGWINMAYTEKVEDTSSDSSSIVGKTGVIINADAPNVRDAAGTSGTNVINTIKKGTKVTVKETVKDAYGNLWGRIQWNSIYEGWIYMYYVKMDNGSNSGGSSSSSSTPANALYSGVVTSNINLNVRKTPNVYGVKVDSLPTGTKVDVYQEATTAGVKWGRIGSNKWVCLQYVNKTAVYDNNSNSNNTETVTALNATVTSNTLDVYKNYNSNSAKLATLKKGDVVTILEKNTEETETGSRIWGRFSKDGVEGWINLAYVELKTVATVTPGTNSGTTSSFAKYAGIVNSNIPLNVRDNPNVYAAKVASLNNGTKVEILEETTTNGVKWGRTNQGWVCLIYVNKTTGTAGITGTDSNGILNGTSSNAISATGYVNNAYLNVRSGAGLGFAQIGTLQQGAKVTMFEQAVADGMIWARINYGNGSAWVCMSYITVENASATGKGVMGTIARCFNAVNVRSAPGTGNALVNTIKVGSRVEVFETRKHGADLWGRVAQGWVSMQYVLLDSELPEGEVLDATTAPTTEATEAPETDETVNTENEVTYRINGNLTVAEVNVYNDADDESDKVGTMKQGYALNILALKENGAELWGRIDQHDTAGWINMDKVSYSVHGYVNTDNQAVYADTDTTSTVKGNLPVNYEVNITKLGLGGDVIFGWVEKGVDFAGWIPVSKISNEAIQTVPTYKSSTDSFGINKLTGTTLAAASARKAVDNAEIVFNVNAGVKVYAGELRVHNGTIWAKLTANSVEGWIELNKISFSDLYATVTAATLNVRTSRDTSSDENIKGTLSSGNAVDFCELSYDSMGKLWGKITRVAPENAEFNGCYVAMNNLTAVLVNQ